MFLSVQGSALGGIMGECLPILAKQPGVFHLAIRHQPNYTCFIFMLTTQPLNQMSKADKLRAMEALWADLSSDDRGFVSPRWHGEVLEETERLVKSGKARFLDWESAKKMIRRKVS